MAARRIGILTGGGDVPGLNSVIKSVVYNATEIGCEVIGIRRGWEGLTHMRRAELLSAGGRLDPDYVRPLDRVNTRTIDRSGGTMLHTSRTNPSKMPARRLPSSLPRRARGPDAGQRRHLRPDAAGARQHRVPGPRLPRHHRRRRHAVLFQGARPDRRAAHRHPQDDGQRRPGDRVLHRLLDGDHARQGADHAPAHDARLA